MNSDKLNELDPAFRPLVEKLIAELATRGITVVITSAYRTPEQQQKLYEQGRTAPGNIVTKAQGLPVPQSPHCYRLAVDLCPVDANGKLWWNAPDDIWHVIHDVAELIIAGLDSGYDWKFQDRPHVESPLWRERRADLMAAHNG